MEEVSSINQNYKYPANMGPAVPDLTAAYFQSVFKIFPAMLPELLVETIAYFNTAVKCDIVSVRLNTSKKILTGYISKKWHHL